MSRPFDACEESTCTRTAQLRLDVPHPLEGQLPVGWTSIVVTEQGKPRVALRCPQHRLPPGGVITIGGKPVSPAPVVAGTEDYTLDDWITAPDIRRHGYLPPMLPDAPFVKPVRAAGRLRYAISFAPHIDRPGGTYYSAETTLYRADGQSFKVKLVPTRGFTVRMVEDFFDEVFTRMNCVPISPPVGPLSEIAERVPNDE